MSCLIFFSTNLLIRSSNTSTTGTLIQQQQGTTSPTDDPTRVAVENLIASIKSKQLQETQRQSDRKILDIIHRVLGRTIDLVYDEDEQEKIQQELERQRILSEQESKMPMFSEDEDTTIISSIQDGNRTDIETEYEKDQEDEDEDIDERDKTISASEYTDQDEQIDITRDPLYRHMLLGITNEDLLNVQGTQINVPSSLIKKNQRRPTKQVKHTDKNVHHFCIQMVDEADVMPKEIRSITQLYHQRARFRHKLPLTSTYHKHGQLPSFPIEEVNEDEEDKPRL